MKQLKKRLHRAADRIKSRRDRLGRRADGKQQGRGGLHQGNAGGVLVPDARLQPYEGHRSRHRPRRSVQCLLQDACVRNGCVINTSLARS